MDIEKVGEFLRRAEIAENNLRECVELSQDGEEVPGLDGEDHDLLIAMERRTHGLWRKVDDARAEALNE